MKICMISSESVPFIKTGGLADVVYSLSRKMVVYKHPTTIVLPYYQKIKNKKEEYNIKHVTDFEIDMSWRHKIKCEVLSCKYRGITYYFLGNDFYFGGRENPYGYFDDQERFAFFQLCSLKMIEILKLAFEIIHLHDWQTGMIPLIYREQYAGRLRREPKFIYTIHNPAFLGLVDSKDLYDYFNLSEKFFDDGTTRFDNKVSYLKTGIMLADRITVVSKTHREELLNGQAGQGLQDCLTYRKGIVRGIVNGIDTKDWNPDKDPFIKHHYTIENVIQQKGKNKREFCKEKGLNPKYPLYGIVSRLTSQKGLDLVTDSLEELIKAKVCIYVLGTGEKEIEDKMKAMAEKYPHNFAIDLKYSEEIAHVAYASCDFFLMPSRFEPCGITQMISHRYGTIPLGRATGGLVDTIIPYNGMNEKDANGFLFSDFNKQAFLSTVQLSLDLYKKKRPYTKIIHNAMKVNNSWTKSYKEYYDLYCEALNK